MAVVRKTRSFQTTGEEWPRPAMGVFQRIGVPLFTSHAVGGIWSSATPMALGPRNEGQFLGTATLTGFSVGSLPSESTTGSAFSSRLKVEVSLPDWYVKPATLPFS